MCNIAVFAAIGNNNDQAPEVSTQAGEDTQDKSQVKQETPDEAVVHVNAGNGYITYGGAELDGKSDSFKAPYAQSLTLQASANEGYKLESVTVASGGQIKVFTGESITIPADMVTNNLMVTLSTVKKESARKGSPVTPIDGDTSGKAGKSDQNTIDKTSENNTDTDKANNLPDSTETKDNDNSGNTDSATTPEQSGEGPSADQNTENSGATEGEGSGGIKEFFDGAIDVVGGLLGIGGDENAEEANVETAAEMDTYYVKVGESITIYGSGSFSNWGSSNNQIATVNWGYYDSNATVTGVSEGTATITHTYWDWGEKTETFTVKVTPATPIGELVISGDDSVTQFSTITLTTNAKASVTWTSSNREIATVDQSGNVKGIAQGEVTIVAETIDVNGTALRAEKMVAVTQSTSNIRDAAIFFLNAPLANADSNGNKEWFPSKGAKEFWGKVNLSNANWNGINTYDNVANRVVSWPDGSAGTSWVLPTESSYWTRVFNAYKSEIEAKLGVTLEQSDVEAIILKPYKISDNSDGIHLDCKVEMKTKGVVTATFMLWDAGATGYAQYGDTIPYKVGTGESAQVAAPTPELEAEKTVGDVKYKLYGWYDNEALTGTQATFPVSTTSNVTYYAKYVRADQMITVNYYKEGTTEKVADSKVIDGLVSGQTVTENAIDVPNYTVVGSTSQTVTAGEASEINFYYTPKTTSYTVHYYWNGTTESVYPDETVPDAVVGESITKSPVTVDGYTPVSSESQTIKLEADGNAITFYYYKNVELTANPGTVTYDGTMHSVSGFTGAPEGADFFAITVGASGTDASTYPANFPEGTVNTVDATGKYIVTTATDGSLVINKRSVTLSSEEAHKTYNSTPLTKPDVTVTGDGFVEGEVTDLKATGSVTNVNQGKVKNTITYTKGENFNADNYNIISNEGELWIDPVTTEITIVITGHNDGREYDGTEHVVSGYDISGLPAGVSQSDVGFNGTAEVKQTDAGTYPMGLDSNQFYLKSPAVENYNNVTYDVRDGKLAIAQRTVKLSSETASKPYDGEPLTKPDVKIDAGSFVNGEVTEIRATGSVTNVSEGEVTNTIVYTVHENFKADNYSIEKNEGKLSIQSTELDVNSVVWTTEDVNQIYSGLVYSAGTATATDKYGNALVVEYSADDVNWTDKTTDITATNVADSKTVKLRATSPNYDDGQYATKSEAITITKRELTITSANADKKYDGTPLTKHETTVSGDGFAEREGAAYYFTGSQTDVGSSDNTFTYTLNDGVNADNYTITCKCGKLTVIADETTEVVVTIEGNTDTVTFDGKSHSVVGYKVTNISNDKYKQDDFSLKEGVEAKATRTDAGTTVMGLTADSFVNTSKNFKKVKFHVTDGYIKIDRKELTLDAVDVEGPADVVYNGQPQKQKPVVKDGDKVLEEGKDYTLTFTDAIDAGRVDVTVHGQGNYDDTKTVNYQILPRQVKLVSKDGSKPYDGAPLTKPEVTGWAQNDTDNTGFVTGEVSDVKATGSVTYVSEGEVTNTIVYTVHENFKADNYSIEKDEGKLSITAASVKDSMIVDYPRDLTYDGNEHKWTPTVTDKNNNALAMGTDYTVSYSTNDFTNVTGYIVVTITGIGNYSGKIERSYQITPALLKVTTGSAEKPFDGTPLTNDEITVKGFVNDEAASYKATGSQTTVGESSNTYAIVWTDTVKSTNYRVEADLGILKVKPASPMLTVTKVVTNEPAENNRFTVGEEIEYKVTVVNNGDVPVTNVVISDSLVRLADATIDKLNVGESKEFTYGYTVTEDDIVAGTVNNIATARGEAPGGKNVTGGMGVVTPVESANPHLTVTKTTTSTPANQNGYTQGEVIKYTVTVTNDGNLTVKGIHINDQLQGVVHVDGELRQITLAPNQQAEAMFEYTVTAEDVAEGKVVNNATASGESEGGNPTVIPGSKEDKTYNPPAPTPTYENPSMVITKTASITSGAKAGDTITYNVAVRNNGDCDLTNVSIVDPLTGDKWNIDKLAVNATESFTTQPYTVTTDDMRAGQVVNTATGTADNPAGKPTNVTPGTATTYIDKINASWTIDKSVTSTPANGSFYKKGESISYQIVVTNTGNVDLTDIELKDSLVNLGAQGSIDKLAPGETRTITYDYKVTAADVSKGKVVNSVTGTATGPDPVKPGGDRDDVNTGEDNPKPAPAPSGDNTNPVAPGGGNGGNGGNAVTPTTPVAPVTPGMTETPSGETPLDANETPLAPANADVHCWVHWWIIVFMLLTLVYGCAVLIRRNGNSRELQEQQDRLLRKDDEQAQR